MNNKEVQLIKYQEYATIIYEIVLIVSFLLLYDEKKKKTKGIGIFKSKTRSSILLINRSIVVIICLVFLYANYENYKKIKNNNEDTSSLELQLFGSILVLCAALISIYVVIKNYNKDAISEFENIEI